jgi:hypothetical protein
MAKYILARGKKPTPVVGYKGRPHPTAPSITIREPVRFLFRPMHPVEIPEDVDVSGWVEKGFIIPVEAQKPPVAVAEPAEAPEQSEPAKVDEEVEEPPLRSPLGEQAGKAVSKANDGGEEDADYEELPGGVFKCLHCGKVYKTESGVIRHVESKH